MKILIFGSNGQLANEFKNKLATNKDVLQVGSDKVDFLNPNQIVQIIKDVKPKLIINCAAYTAVDKAESEQAKAMLINGTALGVIGETAKKVDAAVVHYSTDYVFDGQKKTAYVESDQTDPVNYYGVSKLAGEKFLTETCSQSYIFRISWVYGVYGNNFLKTILRLAKVRPELKVVNDQIGAPTYSADVCAATLKAISDKQFYDKSGLYHMSPYGEVSWYDFTLKILEGAKKQSRFQIKAESVVSITSEQFQTVAKRPKYSLLSSKKLMDTFQVELPEWDKSIQFALNGL